MTINFEFYNIMNISVIGTGYVGLETSSCLAEVGNYLLCLDVDVGKITLLNNGGIPIYKQTSPQSKLSLRTQLFSTGVTNTGLRKS